MRLFMDCSGVSYFAVYTRFVYPSNHAPFSSFGPSPSRFPSLIHFDSATTLSCACNHAAFRVSAARSSCNCSAHLLRSWNSDSMRARLRAAASDSF